jgi:DNA-binding response OmpR family regulator
MHRKILVVDDEPDFTELLLWVFTKEGYGVECAKDGLEALKKAQVMLPDLILLDVMLPELDGTAVCEILRQLPSTANIPIMMITGCATEACKTIALNAGASEYITKPCSPRELVTRVNNVLTARAGDRLDDALW